MSEPQLSARDDFPPGYNMSWFCQHSMAPVPGGCKQCGDSKPGLPVPRSKSSKPKPTLPPPASTPTAADKGDPADSAPKGRPPPPARNAPTLEADTEMVEDGAVDDQTTSSSPALPPPKPSLPPPKPSGAAIPAPRSKPSKAIPPPVPPTTRRLLSDEERAAVIDQQTEPVDTASSSPPPDQSDDAPTPSMPARPNRPPSVSAKSKPVMPTKPRPADATGSKPPRPSPAPVPSPSPKTSAEAGIKPPRPAPVPLPTGGTKPPRPADLPSKPPRPASIASDKAPKPARPAPVPLSTGGTKPPRPADLPDKPPRPASISSADKPAPSGTKPPRPDSIARPSPSARGAVKPSKPKSPSLPPALPARPGPGHVLYHYMVTGPKAVVLYAWEGDASRGELTLKEGDLIALTRWVDPEWLEGDLAGTVGMFPAIFVDVDEPLPVDGPRVCAEFDFAAEAAHELSVGAGEEFSLLGYIDEDWLRCEYRGQIGAIPVSFVEVVEELPGEQVFEGWPEGWAPPEMGTHETDETAPGPDDVAQDGLDDVQEDVVALVATPAAVPIEPVASLEPTPAVVSTPTPVEQVQTPAATNPVAPPSTAGSKGGPSATVLFDWQGEHDDDLVLTQGQTIALLERVDDDWFRGAFGMREGLFPATFVEVVVPLPEPSVASADQPTTGDTEPAPEAADTPAEGSASVTTNPGTGVGLYDYDSPEMGDLCFVAGEKLVLLEAVDADWLRGRKRNGLEGLFPRAFVQVDLEPGVDPSTVAHVVMALYDFESSHDGDLPVMAGDEVEVLEKLEGWIRARRCTDGVEGLVPMDYLEPL